MKRFLYIVTALLLTANVCAEAQTVKELWETGNQAYLDENYQKATQDYETIRALGYESDNLYLNLGNAYFKRGMVGKALLNYNRALRFSPSDKDVLYNISIANKYVQDKIDVIPTFFLQRWMNELRSSITSNAWAGMSLVFFTLMLVAILVYLLTSTLKWRKIGFYGALGLLALFVISAWLAGSQRKILLNPDKAIIMSSAAPVKSSPDQSSKDLFVLHEGTKVAVKDSLGDFREIEISDGNKGWIEAKAIEMID